MWFGRYQLYLVVKLQGIWDHIENPIIIASGCRSKNHNRLQGGHSASAHLKGLAADIRCADKPSRFELFSLALELNARIGINSGFIHVDIDRCPFTGAGIAWFFQIKNNNFQLSVVNERCQRSRQINFLKEIESGFLTRKKDLYHCRTHGDHFDH